MKMLNEKLDKQLHLKMVLFIKENGIKEAIKRMEEEYRYGLMDQDMMVSGKMMLHKAMVV